MIAPLMNDEHELDRLDRLLAELARLLHAPGDESAGSPEETWQRLDLLYESMGGDALVAMLRRQGMRQDSIDEAFAVLLRRRACEP
jgi:hypothetical protein